MQFTLPVFSFLIFMFLPAGKKLFVITALVFSIVYSLIRAISNGLRKTFAPPAPAVVPAMPGIAGAPEGMRPAEHVSQTHVSQDSHQIH
jgi:hypothetical protein